MASRDLSPSRNGASSPIDLDLIADLVNKQVNLQLDFLQNADFLSISQAISRTLETDLVQKTLAQVIDGVPLADVYKESHSHGAQDPGHPVYQNIELSSRAIWKARDLSRLFDPQDPLYAPSPKLRFRADLLQSYKESSFASEAYFARMIEIVAASIHQIAVFLFQENLRTSSAKTITDWTAPAENELWWQNNPDGAPPTLLSHSKYLNHQEYPSGVADVVGYWAEGRIFGGVVLFDRGFVKSDVVFLHPDRKDSCQIYALLDRQIRDLACFLVMEKYHPTACTLYPDIPWFDRHWYFERSNPGWGTFSGQIPGASSLGDVENAETEGRHGETRGGLITRLQDVISDMLSTSGNENSSSPTGNEEATPDEPSASDVFNPWSESETSPAPGSWPSDVAEVSETPNVEETQPFNEPEAVEENELEQTPEPELEAQLEDSCPLPMLASADNPKRMKPDKPPTWTGIYREYQVWDEQSKSDDDHYRWEYDLTNYVGLEEFFSYVPDTSSRSQDPPVRRYKYSSTRR